MTKNFNKLLNYPPYLFYFLLPKLSIGIFANFEVCPIKSNVRFRTPANDRK